MVPAHIVPSPFPYLSILHKNETRIKSLQSSDQIPLMLVLLRGGETGLLVSPLSSFPVSLSGPGIYFLRPSERRPSSRDCNSQPWCNGGENAIVPCSCFAPGTKTLFPHIHFCNTSEPSTTQPRKNSSATESK